MKTTNIQYFRLIYGYSVKNYFIQELRNKLPDNLQYKIDEFLKRYENDGFFKANGQQVVQEDLFDIWLNNFREIKKVINSILINYDSMFLEVNLFDVIHLEILKLKHPYIYQVLYTRKDEILQPYQSENCYYLSYYDKNKVNKLSIVSYLRSKEKDFSVEDDNDIPIFDILLDEYIDKTKLSLTEKEKIKHLVNVLFPRIDEDNGSLGVYDLTYEDSLSVRYTTKFERYFSHSVFGHHLKEDEFEKLMALQEVEVIPLINKWIVEKKITDLSIRVNKYFDFQHVQNYKNILITSLFLLNNNKINGNLIDNRSVINKMFDQDFGFIFGTLNKAKEFFETFFNVENISDPYIVETQLLCELNKRNSRRDERDLRRFPLTSERIEELLKSYIVKFIENETFFEKGFWSLYYSVLKKGSNQNYIDNDIKVKLKDSLNSLSKKESFLGSLIINYGGYDFRVRYDEIICIFDSYEEFENLFFSNIQSEYIEEFKQFYEIAKFNNWKEIQYDFNSITEPQ